MPKRRWKLLYVSNAVDVSQFDAGLADLIALRLAADMYYAITKRTGWRREQSRKTIQHQARRPEDASRATRRLSRTQHRRFHIGSLVMVTLNFIHNTFTSGVISRALQKRSDLIHYQKGARLLEKLRCQAARRHMAGAVEPSLSLKQNTMIEKFASFHSSSASLRLTSSSLGTSTSGSIPMAGRSYRADRHTRLPVRTAKMISSTFISSKAVTSSIWRTRAMTRGSSAGSD